MGSAPGLLLSVWRFLRQARLAAPLAQAGSGTLCHILESRSEHRPGRRQNATWPTLWTSVSAMPPVPESWRGMEAAGALRGRHASLPLIRA